MNIVSLQMGMPVNWAPVLFKHDHHGFSLHATSTVILCQINPDWWFFLKWSQCVLRTRCLDLDFLLTFDREVFADQVQHVFSSSTTVCCWSVSCSTASGVIFHVHVGYFPLQLSCLMVICRCSSNKHTFLLIRLCSYYSVVVTCSFLSVTREHRSIYTFIKSQENI